MNLPLRPDDRDVLLQRAKALRAEDRLLEALAVLADLQRRHPRFSRLFQERGHCHIVMRDAPAALEALQEAVRLNPGLPAAWDMLEQLHRMTGDGARATEAATRLAALRRLPQAVVAANSLMVDGDLGPAEDIIRDHLRSAADDLLAQRLLARIHTERGDHGEAERALAEVLDRAPDFHAARLDLGMALLQQQKHALARAEADRLLRHDANDRDHLKLLAAACVGQGDHEPVIDLYARLLEGRPPTGAEVADLRLWRANALKVVGRQPEAVADYHASLTARPDNGVAWFSLANLKTYRFTDDQIARMQAIAARPDLQPMDRIYLSFALGKALEDRQAFEASWRAYEAGNALRRALGRYRPEAAEACAERLKATFTPAFFAERAGWGAPDPAPIFIVGLPRSGSTLIEQILASHSRVEGTQELTEIDRYAAELCGRDLDCGLSLDPARIAGLTEPQARALGERFLTETRAYRRLDRPIFIDKAPHNFWHIGLIQLILPNARIIDVRREPMACGFSNLKQLFGTTNHAFAYGAEDIGRYDRAYLGLMRHWDAVLPGRVLRVVHEDVVDDLEGQVRRLLAHCDLPFEDACLSFHETRRSVRTPSSEQVRRPIDREGLEQWRHYAPWLGALGTALGDAVTRWRD